MMTVDLLLVDDEESLIRALEKWARRNQMECAVARNGLEAMEFLAKSQTAVALVDMTLPGYSGLQILEHVKANHLDCEVILMTGKATIETAVAALKKGAYDYLTKPFDDLDRVARVVQKALEKVRLVRKIRDLELPKGGDHYLDLIGRSPKMWEVFGLIERVAPSQSSVMILGESGTGKELVARAIHEKSGRQGGAFVVINCSALPEPLLESELFGHEKGAFTGAIYEKKGLFEVADGGTIFLDEIGEVSSAVQVKLLRVLQNGEIRRLGGAENLPIDVRVLSASNKDLHQWVRKKEFREDLFYRLNVITLTLPPLRDRKEDIPLLASHFLEKFAERAQKKVRQISVDALQTLQEYRWPGNVRELENLIERAVVLAEGETITAKELPPKLLGEFFYLPEPEEEKDFADLPYGQAKEKTLNLFNRAYISHLLRGAKGNVSMAAGQAGMDRSNFKKIIRRCGLNVREFRREFKRKDESE